MKYILTLLFSLSIFASTEVTWLGQAATLIKTSEGKKIDFASQ